MYSASFSSPSARLAGMAILATSFLLVPARADVTTGLTAYWNFNNNLTDQAPTYPFAFNTLADNAEFSDPVNSAYGTGLFGQGYEGNGSAGHAAVPLSPDVSGLKTGSHTISFWFLAKGTASEWQALASVGEGSAWRVARVGNDDPLKIGYAGGSADIASSTTFGPNGTPSPAWHHVVAVSEAGVSTRLFIDGVLESTGGPPTLTTNGSTEMWIGGNTQSAPVDGRSWNGSLDDMAIWSRALTAADVAQIYTAGKTNARSLGDLLTQEATDTDSDGLPDSWELANLPAGAVNDNGSVNLNFGPNGDPDLDLLINVDELARATKPQVADTDGDGLTDKVENGGGTYTSTSQTGTDPLIADTDKDGLRDGVEVPGLAYDPLNANTQPGTSPHDSDSDDDGYSDGFEIRYGFNPKLAGDVDVDDGGFVDDFEDGTLDASRWLTTVESVPAGAAVVQEGGHVTLTGRGHLYTATEFDPEALGGIYISGRWTLRSATDFIQILTRSDAVPAPDYGETTGGVEFTAVQADNALNISARAGVSVGSVTRSGAVSLVNGLTYDFTVIDDGKGYLSFRISEVGNPVNAAIVSAQLTDSSNTLNHVVFHNREEASRISHLEEVVIRPLTDMDADGIPDFWELTRGTSKTVSDATADPDADTVNNGDEYLKGLQPRDNDTDNDGAPDGTETLTGFWGDTPADRGTDPLKPDSDGDGLLDGVETKTDTYAGDPANTGTNPNLLDTDLDGMGDGAEVAAGRNPVDPSDGESGLHVGLTAYWNFDGTLEDIAQSANVGDSTVADNGTFTGAPDVFFAPSGKFGSNALGQNGGNGWVTVPKSVDTIGGALTRSVSVSLWVQASEFSSEWQAAIAHGEGGYWRIARQGVSDPAIFGYCGGGAGSDIYSTSTFTAPTDWINIIAVTEEGSGTRLYINGSQEGSSGEPNLDLNLTLAPNLFIGANPGAAGREWDGLIDDVALWNRALSADEVSEIYNGGTAGSSLGKLLGVEAPSITISAYSYDPATKQVSLTWNSVPGTNYGVFYSTDLADWTNPVIASTPASAGATTTYSFTVPAAVNTATRLFFRVKSLVSP